MPLGATIQTLGRGFHEPWGVALDTSGNIYVTEPSIGSIKKMNFDGTNIQILRRGFVLLTGVAVDTSRNIYITDTGFNSTITEINASGEYIKTIGSGFNTASGVAVDVSGNIYVADLGNSRIIKLTPSSAISVDSTKSETNEGDANHIMDTDSTSINSDENEIDKVQDSNNPDLNMEYTLSHLDKIEDAKSAYFKKWMESKIIDDDDFHIFSSKVQELQKDKVDLDYEGETNFSRNDFDKKWKGKIDYKYLGWYQFLYNGQDGPKKMSLSAKYVGKISNSYFYKIKIISKDKSYHWPNQESGKIYKIEEIQGKPLITGIFEKGESVVWSGK